MLTARAAPRRRGAAVRIGPVRGLAVERVRQARLASGTASCAPAASAGFGRRARVERAVGRPTASVRISACGASKRIVALPSPATR